MKQTGLMFLIQSMLTWHGLGLNQFFLSVLDKIAHFKTIRIKQRTQPWMSTEMIKFINLRDNYLRQFRKSKNQSDYELFIYHRNQVKYKSVALHITSKVSNFVYRNHTNKNEAKIVSVMAALAHSHGLNGCVDNLLPSM